ncbi:MAG: sugar ABC transporter permease [Bacillota bacterium]|nr:sugar ABC transporter permease [Bacillota bacterium]
MSEAITGYLFVAPFLLTIGTFVFLAAVYALYLSFHKYDLFTPPEFVGLANYRRLLADRDLRIALRNVVIYAAGVVPIQTAVALFLAVLANQRLKLRGFFRSAYYVPCITSSVASSIIFMWLYYKQGIINYILSLLRLPSDTDWLGNPSTALPAIMTLVIWTTSAYFMVVFLAALQDIPVSVCEASRIDGASTWQTFRHVTLPLLRPSIFLVVVLGTIGCMQVFDQVYIMTRGGPLKSTMSIVYLVYTEAFGDLKFGYGAAMAFALFAVIFVLTLIQRRLLDIRIEY